MQVLPILKSLRRNKVGALLISLQIAITLAIACNCVSIVQQYVQRSARPSGLDEANIFSFSNQWVGKPTDLGPRAQADLAAIRAVPGVIDAQVTNSFPLRGGGWSWGLALKPDQKGPTASTTLYFVDQHGLAAYGLRLLSGRWFTAAEVGEHGMHDIAFPASIVVTAALAHVLFPSGRVLGQVVYWTPTAPSRIVGIVERAQTPWAGSDTGPFSEASTFLPYHFINSFVNVVVRTRPGALSTVMPVVQERLYSLSRQRVINQVQTYGETRAYAYFRSRATAVLVGALCALLLVITVFGIIGLTMYWVGQRRRQIGMRRALGARRIDILRYFQIENLLICGLGAAIGAGLGLAGNLWLVTHVAQPRMSTSYILVGALIVMACSQAAVLWPALRAAAIPPAVATRGR